MSERFGDYELIQKIATGGMAEIYLARHVASQGFARAVVVKRMLPQLAVRRDFVTMFLDEARLAANLSHPNVVQVFNLGEAEGSYFMAMELVDGPHLGSLFAHSLRQRRPLPVELCVYICARSADGLDHAHDLKDPSTGLALQIVHRDISPQNILVSRHGDVKVTDFGVAKATTQEAKTRTGIIKGKVSYMSPEQCLGDRVDRRTDVFALGIVLYELLTRRRLFRDKSDLLVMQRITQEAVPPPSTLNPSIDAELDAICMRALERDRNKRYSTAADFSEALDVWLALHGIADARARLGKWMVEHAPDLGISQAALDTPIAPAEAPFPIIGPDSSGDQTTTTPLPYTGATDDQRLLSQSAAPLARSAAVRPLDLPPEATIPNPTAADSTSLPAEGGTLVTPPPFAALRPEEPEHSTDEASDPSQPPLVHVEAHSRRLSPLVPLEPTVADVFVEPVRPRRPARPIAIAAASALVLALVVGVALWRSSNEGSGNKTASTTVAEPDAPADDPQNGDANPDDKPPVDEPPDAKPPVDKPSGESPSDDKPPVDKPPDDKPSGENPSDDKPDDAKDPKATTRLVVTTVPSKVPVFLGDERFLGMSPVEIHVVPQKVAKILAHFPSGTETVEVALTDAQVKLELAAHIPLTLRSSPSGASAVITGPGMEKGVKVVTPVAGNVKLRAGGSYSVEVTASGHQSEKLTLVADGKMVEQTVTLRKDRETSRPQPKPVHSKPAAVERPTPTPPAEVGEGLVSIFSEPWTSVTIAGRSFPATPVTREKVKTGSYVVRVVRREYGINETLKVTVPKDGNIRVIFVFEDKGDGKYKLKSKRTE